MRNRGSLIIMLVAIGLATTAGITTHHITTPSTSSEAWYRTAEGVKLEPIGSGIAYMYTEMTSAGVISKVEPTPEDYVSDIRQTDILYRSDKNGNLCRTYISWDADLQPGDHMVLTAIYKYRPDLDATDGFEPTVLVGREVTGFEITKK